MLILGQVFRLSHTLGSRYDKWNMCSTINIFAKQKPRVVRILNDYNNILLLFPDYWIEVKFIHI